MRPIFLLTGILLTLISGNASSRTNFTTLQKESHYPGIDSAIWTTRKDSLVTINKRDKLGLENLLGQSKSYAIPIISHFKYKKITEHPKYPNIKDVLEITNLRRWNFPLVLYIFIDSSDRVCRMNYILGSQAGMTATEAHSIFEDLTKSHGGLNYVPDKDWEIAGWQEKDKSYLLVWQKGATVVKPSYLLTLKTYLDDHLLPFMKDHQLPYDGIFTPIPESRIDK